MRSPARGSQAATGGRPPWGAAANVWTAGAGGGRYTAIMLEAICRRAFFSFEVPIRYRERPPRIDGTLRDWPPEHLLPALCEIEGAEPHTDVYAAWNEAGLYIAFDSPQRAGPPRCDLTQWWKGDGVRICIDTRDARDVRRATRYCHFFYALPVGGGKKLKQPIVQLHAMSRAKENPPGVDSSQVQIAAHVERTHVSMELAFPADALHGWDPLEHPRIGFFYKVNDVSAGGQHLTVDDELGWNVDPSTWATAVLVR